MHSEKFSRREKVEALEKNTQNISGYVILRTAEGVEYHLPTKRVAALLAQVEKTIDWQKGACPSWIFTRHPRLTWFRDAISVQSTDNSNFHQQVLGLIARYMPQGKVS
jgi:hypothetical protein